MHSLLKVDLQLHCTHGVQLHCTHGVQCNSLMPSKGTSQLRCATLHELGVRPSPSNRACLAKAKQAPKWTAAAAVGDINTQATVDGTAPGASRAGGVTGTAATTADAGHTCLAPAKAAPVAPEVVLQPIPGTSRVPLSGPFGDWSDVAVDRGYFGQQQQQQGQQQQQPRQLPDQQQRRQRWQGKRQQQHVQQEWRSSSSPSRRRSIDPARYAAALTVRITQQDSVMGLLSVVTSTQQRGQLNMRHLSTICRILVDLQQKQQRLQQRHQHQQQQWQQQIVHLDCTGELLQLVENRVILLLKDAAASASAAAQTGGDSSRSSGDAMLEPRSISTLVYCWGKLGYQPQVNALELLLDAFLQCYQSPPQLPPPPLQQQEAAPLQQQEQQLVLDAFPQHERIGEMAAAAATAGFEPNSQSGSSSSSSNSSSNDSDSDNSRSQGSFMSLSNLCWGLNKLGYTCNSAYGRSDSRRDRFGHTSHSGSSSSEDGVSSSIRQQRQQQYWSQLAGLVQEGSSTASARDLSSICYAFAAGGYSDVVLWSRLAPCLISCMDDCLPQDLSQLLWGYATAGVRHEGLFLAAVPAVRQTIHGFTPQGLINVLWAYTTSQGRVPEPLLQAASAELLDRSGKLASFGPLNLSMLAWVFAKCRTISPLLAAAISRAAIQVLPSFLAPDLCRLLSSLALLRSADVELLNATESRMLSMLEQPGPDANIQIVTHGAWAFAASNHPGASRLIQPLLHLAAKHVGVLIRSGEATCRLLDTLVLLRYRADGFVQLLADKLLGVAPAAPTAKSQVRDEAVMPAAAKPPAGTSKGDAAAAAAAVSAAVVANAKAAGAAGAAATNPLDRWASLQLVRVAAALARLGYTQQHAMLQLLMLQFASRLPQLPNATGNKSSGSSSAHSKQRQQQQVHVQGTLVRQSVQLLWSSAVLDVQQPMQCLKQLINLLKHAETTGYQLPPISLAQLVQVHMWLQEIGPAGKPLVARLPQGWLEQGLYFWQQEMVPAVTRSPLHNNVMSTLATMRLPAVCEGVTPDGMFSIDVVVNFKGCEVALEVMGDEHYSSNPVILPAQQGQQQAKRHMKRKQRYSTEIQLQQAGPVTEPQHVLLGPELLRMRLLAARGYALAIVSSFDWERAKSKRAAQLLLTQRLQEAVTAYAQHQRTGVRSNTAGSGDTHTAREPKQATRDKQQGDVQGDAFDMLLQEQLSEGSLVAEQVGRLVQQQGRSKHAQRGLLRGERYKQQRQDLHQEGMQLLLMAAPWAAARSGRQGKVIGRGEAGGSSITNSLDDWGADGGMGSVTHHEAKELEIDEDFDISLNLEDLLGDQEKGGAATDQ